MPSLNCKYCDEPGGNEYRRTSPMFDDGDAVVCDRCWTNPCGQPFSLKELTAGAEQADAIPDALLSLWVDVVDMLTPSPTYSKRDLLELTYDGSIPREYR